MSARERIQETVDFCRPGREILLKARARRMEQCVDKQGLVFERWLLPNGTSLVLVATSQWWNVFRPVTESNRVADTERAIAELAQSAFAGSAQEDRA